jgi:hypothetical protein
MFSTYKILGKKPFTNLDSIGSLVAHVKRSLGPSCILVDVLGNEIYHRLDGTRAANVSYFDKEFGTSR